MTKKKHNAGEHEKHDHICCAICYILTENGKRSAQMSHCMESENN